MPLSVTIPAAELFDEGSGEFIIVAEQKLQLEHSLVSLAKWEAKYCKPFLTPDNKSRDECVDYVRCMTLTQNVPSNVYKAIPDSVMAQVNEYIERPMTATWFSENKNTPKSREVVTAELIYYWMIALNVPFECQKWHLNRLLTLIRVCNEKNTPPKKMSRNELYGRNRSLNASRKSRLHTRG
ncbi:MAG: hypothetical protein J6T99_06360 [Oscillospiraceae bacterium]|nr:hypothetical protein [Oscillospiraceae bacterium]